MFMKNVYVPKSLLKNNSKIEILSPSSEVFGYDKVVAESFEKLNPIMSYGHRCNPITVIMDPSIPKEVSSSLLQFVQKNPAGSSFTDMTDDELLAVLPSRYMQSEPQLDMVRDALTALAAQYGVGEPEPTSVAPDATLSVESQSE